MKKISSLNEIIEFDSNFKSAINLYLSLNKPEKVLGYIPTNSSMNFLCEYLNAVLNNKEQATLLVGPYGKGKSHLLLVLLAILSMDRTASNEKVIKTLIDKVSKVDEIGDEASLLINKVWKRKKFLPVLITDSTGDLNQAFLYGLNDALKRDGLLDLIPDTFYSIAIERINEWKEKYPATYTSFEDEVVISGRKLSSLMTELSEFSKEALELFVSIYPKITAGSIFNPMAVSEVLPLYKSTSEKLVEEYGYSGIYIVFDEFSKFIESQDGQTTGLNMRLIQDMCELANDSKNSQVFFTMIAHKSIKEYGKYLSQDIINSFTGIEGRIIEKYFITSSKNNYELIRNAIIKDESKLEAIPHYDLYLGDSRRDEYFQLPLFKSNFLLPEFTNIIYKGCYPLNPLAAYLLLNVSEKVAQNERTLFTFISNDEPHSMARFISEHTEEMEWGIGADLIYDYFSTLFKKDVNNEYVHNIWLSAEYTIEKCDSEDQRKLVKALAIILIVNKEDEIPANDKYLKLCVNAIETDLALNDLLRREYIYRKNATGSFMFKTRAGAELKAEIRKQREIKGENVKYSKALLDVTGKYYIVPRKYNTQKMMTRYFVNEFMLVDDFLSIKSSAALMSDEVIDGKVLMLFSFNNIKQETVRQHLCSLADERLVVVCPKRGFKAKKQLCDYEIIKELRDNQVFINNNEILKKELPLLLDDLTVELDTHVNQMYEEDEDTRIFYFDGKKVCSAKVGNEELVVNDCCNRVYTSTPIVNNEMVNRFAITSVQTKKARLNVIQAIISHEDTEDFYAGSNQEATVYRSLFTVTGIIDGNPNEDVKTIINLISNFIDSCSDKKVLMTDLINKLVMAPYGLRRGLIPFYLAYSIANRKEDIIVYFAGKEIQISADIIVNMVECPEDYSMYVSKEDLQKEKYISKLNNLFLVEDNRNLSTNRIKNILTCMQRWFRALPSVSRNAIYLDKYVTEEVILKAMKEMKKSMQKVEFNPFEILFVEFPNAFGEKSLDLTYEIIEKSKCYFDEYYLWIEQQAIEGIYNLWDSKRKQDLYHVLKEWYERQSKRSKQGLYNGRVTNFMSCLESLDVYSDEDVAQKVVKAVTDVYLENWIQGSIDDFENSLSDVKREIESIRDAASAGELELNFVGRNGGLISRLYSHADESTGSVLRNIIEDTLEEYDDLSVNDRVSILLEMIEKIIK